MKGGPRAIVLVAVVVIGLLAAMNWDEIGMATGPLCIVGVQGTAASLQVQGWTANQVCAAFEAGTPGTYRYRGQLTTPVVCQYDIRGNRFTVHDEGILKLIGNAACIALSAARSNAEIASTLATTSPTAPPHTRITQPPATPALTPAQTTDATYNVRPALRDISLTMSRTVERGNTSTHFSAFGDPVTVTDGAGGLLTAVVGVRFPTADGYGRLVFFWHGASFLGWNSIYESIVVSVDAAGPATFALTYPHFAPGDPVCCPSLPAVKIMYRWNGSALVPDGSPPQGPGNPVAVESLP